MSSPTPLNSDIEPASVVAALLGSCDEGVVVMNLDGVVRTWNAGATAIYGYDTDEITGRSILEIMPPEAAFRQALETVSTGRTDRRQVRHRRKDGQALDVLRTVTPTLDAAGRPVGAVMIVHDLVESTRVAAALQRSELRWRAIVESAVDAIIVIDGQGTIEAFNPSAERLFGYATSEVLGQNVRLLMPSPYSEEHSGYLASYLKGREPKVIGVGREVVGLHRDGTQFPIHLSVGEINANGERRFTGIIHDLRPRARIEERLRDQTALARLGEMAAVIAHEVRNPLAGVRGAIQVIGSRLPRESADAEMVKEIVSRIDGLNELIKDLLLFARPPSPKPFPADVASLVAGTVELLKADPALRGVEVTVEGSAAPIVVDAALVKTVFLNLLINAAQAMQGKGTITVSIGAADGWCEIAFTDSGPGIPAEIREKIFSPFFTTKSRGTGLGLSTARTLVESHGGTLDVACPASGGTTVTVRLPS